MTGNLRTKVTESNIRSNVTPTNKYEFAPSGIRPEGMIKQRYTYPYSVPEEWAYGYKSYMYFYRYSGYKPTPYAYQYYNTAYGYYDVPTYYTYTTGETYLYLAGYYTTRIDVWYSINYGSTSYTTTWYSNELRYGYYFSPSQYSKYYIPGGGTITYVSAYITPMYYYYVNIQHSYTTYRYYITGYEAHYNISYAAYFDYRLKYFKAYSRPDVYEYNIPMYDGVDYTYSKYYADQRLYQYYEYYYRAYKNHYEYNYGYYYYSYL